MVTPLAVLGYGRDPAVDAASLVTGFLLVELITEALAHFP